MTLLPACRDIRLVAGASVAVTLFIALALAYQRAGIGKPFEIPVYRHLILFQDYYAILPFVVILLAALLPQMRELGARAAWWCGRHVWAVAVVTAVVLAAGARTVYHTHPLSMDEYVQLFQSRIFLEGRLTAQFPPELMDWLVPKFFQGRFFRVEAATGTVATVYWPGFSLLLVPFEALGASWLLNPLLGGVTVLVMHRLALALFGSAESAGYVVLLTLASPAVTINALSYYSMPAHLVANALFMLLLLKPTPARAFGAGLLGSLALVLHNPAPHLLFATPWVVWLALQPDRLRVVGALVAGYLPLSLALGWGWAIFLESVGGAAAIGDLATPGGAAGTFARRLSQVIAWRSETGVAAQLFGLGKLWLWAAPGLLAAAALGAWRTWKEEVPWRLMAASALLTYFAYFLVRFDQGHGWGFRYFHPAWAILPLLALAATRTASSAPRESSLPSYLAACAILSLALLTTFRALQVEQFISRHLAQLPTAAAGEVRAAFIDSDNTYYGWDLVQNDPFLRERPLRFTSLGADADRAMMAARFPDYRPLRSDWRGSAWGAGR